jgi:hypothetical protein
METINGIRSYFADRYGHVSLDQLTDSFILEYLEQSYLVRLSFEMRMDCLYDYILAQDLCDVVK